MPWVILLFSAVCEAIWATALGQSDGLSKPVPSIVFLVTMIISLIGLGHAARHIPIGTAYAVWTGIGASLTVSWAMLTGAETVSVLKIIFIAGIIGATLGLRFTEDA